MSLFPQIPFNKMFTNSRYLIWKLGHIMQMSFNMFNFRARMALSRVPPWIPSPLPPLFFYKHTFNGPINNVPLYDWPELPDVGGFMVSSSVRERGEALWESLYLSTKGCCMWLGNIPAGVIIYLSVSSHLDCNGPVTRIYQFLTKLVIKSLI